MVHFTDVVLAHQVVHGVLESFRRRAFLLVNGYLLPDDRSPLGSRHIFAEMAGQVNLPNQGTK